MQKKLNNLLLNFSIFKNLDSSTFERAISLGRFREINENTILYRPTDRCKALGFLLNGTLKMSKFLSSGEELTIRTLDKGETFADLICFSNENYPCYISSFESSLIFELPTNSLLNLLKEDIFLTSFIKDISRKALLLNEKIELLALKRVDQRIAYYLLSNNEIDISVTGLANILNSSREAVSRTISKMVKSNILMHSNQKISILNKLELEKILKH